MFAAASVCGIDGSGGNGGSLIDGDSVASDSVKVASDFVVCVSSTRPSEDTLTCVIEAGRATLLLDLRLVRNLLGESSRGFLASSLGSSPVAPKVTPMLSLAVLTMAGAFDRQLPLPDSHFLPLGVCVPGVAGGVALLAVAVEAAKDVVDGASGSMSLALGVPEGECATLASEGASPPVLSSAGAWVLGRDFLRGFIPAGRRNRGESRRRGRCWGVGTCATCEPACVLHPEADQARCWPRMTHLLSRALPRL